MDKMRQEFEAWCREHGYTLRPAETNCGVRIDGAYGHRQVQLAWEAWQASRAALTIDLPECWNEQHADYKSDLIDALDRDGVNYK